MSEGKITKMIPCIRKKKRWSKKEGKQTENRDKPHVIAFTDNLMIPFAFLIKREEKGGKIEIAFTRLRLNSVQLKISVVN